LKALSSLKIKEVFSIKFPKGLVDKDACDDEATKSRK
jgi:hypothetical protein